MGAKAQVNHVLNPSFENLTSHDSITFPTIDLVKLWHGTDSSNYQLVPSILFMYPNQYLSLPIPNAGWGGGGVYQYPRTGKVISILVIYGQLFRDYAVGQLDEKLVAGKTYCLSFYCNLSKPIDEGIANNHICAYVGDNSLDTILSSSGKVVNYFTPQIVCNNVVSDTMNWTKEEASFVATGNETRIILGNFYFDYQTTVLVIDPNAAAVSEYFIDDVSVVETAAHVQAGKDTTINEGDTIELGAATTVGLPCEWYTMNNQIIGRGSTAVITPNSTASYYVRMDICGNVTYDTIKVSVVPTGIERLTMNDERLVVYPNPCNDELRIRNLENRGNGCIRKSGA